MPDPTYAEISGAINTEIVTNHNNEITAAVLNPILIGMLDYTSSSIGSLDDLNTSDKGNVVAAINEALARIDDIATGIIVLQGQEDPNETPPAEAFGIGDMYSQTTVGGMPIYLYIYTGVGWYRFTIPNFADVVAQGGDLNVSMLNNDGDGVNPFITSLTVDGMNLTVNQAASEINLTNADGDVISTVSLAFLNNEGTTFIYNDVTRMLELWNDVPEKVSEIPVDDFVSNLVHSASFNATTPSILEFKDTANNVLFSVTYTINNISGLQAALNSKQDTLVSGSNIKTVGGVSLLGSGNVTEVQNSLTASTTLSPSVTAVNTALSSKANDSNVIHTTGDEVKVGNLSLDIPSGALLFKISRAGEGAAILGSGTGGSGLGGVMQLFHTAGLENVRIYASGDSWINGGNLGIKTATPIYPLDVNGVGRFKRIGINGFGFANILIVSSDAKTIGDSQSILFQGHNVTDSETNYGYISTTIENNASGGHSSSMVLSIYNAASAINGLSLTKDDVMLSTKDGAVFRGITSGGYTYLQIGSTNAKGRLTALAGTVMESLNIDADVTILSGTIQMDNGVLDNEGATMGQLRASVRPYKSYAALITQTGTVAPVATILENNLGFTPTWSYVSAGQYKLNWSGGFPVNKVACFINGIPVSLSATAQIYRAFRFNNDEVNLITNFGGTAADGMLATGSVIEVRIYS